MAGTDQHSGFSTRGGSRFASAPHETTIHGGDSDNDRISTPTPSPPRRNDMTRRDLVELLTNRLQPEPRSESAPNPSTARERGPRPRRAEESGPQRPQRSSAGVAPPSATQPLASASHAQAQVAAPPMVGPAQQTEAEFFFEQLSDLAKQSTSSEDIATAKAYRSCAKMYYYSAAGSTVWEDFTQETRESLKQSWQSQMFEAGGVGKAVNLMLEYLIHLLEVHQEQWPEVVPAPTKTTREVVSTKDRMFDMLMTTAIRGRHNDELAVRNALHQLLDEGASDDDLIDALCTSRIMYPSRPLFDESSLDWAARLEDLSLFTADLGAQLAEQGYLSVAL